MKGLGRSSTLLAVAGPITGLLAVACLLLMAGERVRGLLLVSLSLGGMAAAIAALFGAMLALLFNKTDAPGRRGAWLLLGGMILTPLYLHAAAWRAGFGLLGWATQAAAAGGPIDPLLADLPGAVWVHAMAATPWAALIVGAALRTVSAEHEESASLDAPPDAVLRRVTLRRAAMGVGLAALWTVLTCTAEMTVTDLFNVRTFAEEVYTQAALGAFDGVTSDGGQRGSSSVQQLGVRGIVCGGLLLVLATTWLLVAGARLLIDPNDQEQGKRWRWRLGAWKPLGAALGAVVLALVAGLPIANLAHQAGIEVTRKEEGWQREWSASKLMRMVVDVPQEHRRELLPSLALGVVVACTATLLGLGLAWSMASGGVWRGVWLTLLAAGLVVPGPLIGIATIRLLNQPIDSPLGGLTWFYDQTWFAPWLVQTFRVTPLATLVLWPALASLPRELIDTATADGASRWGVLWRVAAPIRWPTIAAAWVIVFAAGIGELAATVLVLPPGPQTLTVRVFSLLHYGVDDRVAALCLFLIFGYLVLGGLAAWLIGLTRRMRQTSSASQA